MRSRKSVVATPCTSRNLIAVLWMCGAISAHAQSIDYSPGFSAGAPSEMARLSFLVGQYEISLYFPGQDAAGQLTWLPWASTRATIAPALDGAVLQEANDGFPIAEDAEGADGIRNWQYLGTWSYDRFNRTYRTIVSDNIFALADIYEGQFDGNMLVLSNLNTNTFNNMGNNGDRQKNRITVSRDADQSFVVTWYTLDGSAIRGSDVAAQAWVPSVRMHYIPEIE